MSSLTQDHWNGLRQDNQHAFESLYSACWKPLYSFAYRILGDKAEASDLVQELFIRIWEKRSRLPETENAEAYLFRWMKSLVLNHLKATGIREKHLEAFGRAVLRTEETILDNVAEKEVRKQLMEHIEALPEKMREIFYMNRIEHIPVSEIAKRLNLSEQTVRNQVNLAAKRIRPVLNAALMLYLIS